MNNKNNPSAVNENSLTPLAKRFLWVEKPEAIRRAVIALALICVLLFVIDLFYHRHAYFSWEATSAFYAITGFLAFTIIVLAAGQLRRLIKRDENYYGHHSVSGEAYPEEGLHRQSLQHSASQSDNAENNP